MGNKAETLYTYIKQDCSQVVCEQAAELFVGVEKASPAKQGRAIKACLEMMQSNQADVQTVLRQCNCLSNSVIDKAKKSVTIADGNMSEFLRLLNQQHIGGGQLHIDDKGKIIGIYSSCYCGLPKAIKDMPSCYCQCSAGWFEKLFSSVLERKVEVTLIHTILDGDSECVFEIA